MSHVELVDPQGTILSEIADRKFNQRMVAQTYAWCWKQCDQVDFSVINRAILDRWSMAGLERIKALAWKRAAS